MSNRPHMRVSDKRTGLVEIVTEDGKVTLQLFPPGQTPVILPMGPEQARGLAQGLLEGAEEAERGTDT